MRLIALKTLIQFYTLHPNAKKPLETWYSLMKAGQFHSLAELRIVFSSADPVGRVTVFNIKGNDFRLITAIHYNTLTVYILEMLTHGDYDRGAWKRTYQVYD